LPARYPARATRRIASDARKGLMPWYGAIERELERSRDGCLPGGCCAGKPRPPQHRIEEVQDR